jgi:hypothetical protein
MATKCVFCKRVFNTEKGEKIHMKKSIVCLELKIELNNHWNEEGEREMIRQNNEEDDIIYNNDDEKTFKKRLFN